MTEREQLLLESELTHAVDLLLMKERTFDNLADAAATIARAANRTAPDGYSVRFERRDWRA